MERSEALDIVRKNWPDSGYSQLREALQTLIPELKESEDEKIRKELFEFINGFCAEDNHPFTLQQAERWLAWLEKQYEHVKFLQSIQIGDEVTRNPDGVLVNLSQFKRKAEQGSQNLANSAKTCKVEPKFKVGDIMRTLQEASNGITDGMPVVVSIDNEYYRCNNEIIAIKDQDNYEYPPKNREQKPANKVEPKFKVGDWITNNIDTDKIIGIDLEDENYLFENGRKSDISLVESISHIWTIQDAKDGDVLVHEGEIFMIKSYALWNQIVFHYCYTGKVLQKHGVYHFWTKEDFDNVHPAAQEQRDLLFQKMRDAGYEWDAEKKELKKIEQNPTWSEEDEQYLLVCKNALAKYQTTDKWDAGIISHWLEDKFKLLKEKYTWKPSDEQIKVFEHFVRSLGESGYMSPYDPSTKIVYSLLDSLKKLKG